MLRYTRERLDREGLFGVETRLARLPPGPGPEEGFDGALAIGVLNYVRDIEGALKMLVSSLKAGGWAVFNVPARSAEGRIYALAEFVNRRRIYLYSLPEIVWLGERMGLRVGAASPSWSVPRNQVSRSSWRSRQPPIMPIVHPGCKPLDEYGLCSPRPLFTGLRGRGILRIPF